MQVDQLLCTLYLCVVVSKFWDVGTDMGTDMGSGTWRERFWATYGGHRGGDAKPSEFMCVRVCVCACVNMYVCLCACLFACVCVCV